MASLTQDFMAALQAPRRLLAWLFHVEGDSDDLYAWSGIHTLGHDGQTYKGVGHVASLRTIRKTEDVEHVEQQLTLSGLDPSALISLDTSVRGRTARVSLAALNDAGQVIASPLVMNELVQDNLTWTRAADDTVTLVLNCWEALPFIGRTKGTAWSNDAQQAEYSGDVGFQYNTAIALKGAPVDWRLV